MLFRSPDRVLILKHKNGLKVDDSRWINNIDSSKIKFRTDNDLYEDLVFDTFDEAKNYAINNPGTYFTCNKSCHKYIIKNVVEYEQSYRQIFAKFCKLGIITTEEHKIMVDDHIVKQPLNKLFDIFMNNSYVAVNLLSRFYP